MFLLKAERKKPAKLSLTHGIKITRNSSEDEIANVNFLYDDIVHVLQNTIDSCIPPQIEAAVMYGTHAYQIQ